MNVLAIGAHFDDIELGCCGTLLRHKEKGDKIYMLVITDSEYLHYTGAMMRTKEVAKSEGEAAALIIGAELICANFKTKELKYDVTLIESIEKVVVDKKIDILYTHWDKDVHQDHAATGRATLSAARHVPNIFMYQSNWYKSTDLFQHNFYVEITKYIDKKILAVKAHETELKKIGPKWIDFFVAKNRDAGLEVEVQYAEKFQMVKYLMK